MPTHSLADIGHDTDAAIIAAYAHADEFRQQLERLATLVEQLIAERTHIRQVLTAFYRSDITMSALQPLLDLAREINPALNEWQPTQAEIERERRAERSVR